MLFWRLFNLKLKTLPTAYEAIAAIPMAGSGRDRSGERDRGRIRYCLAPLDFSPRLVAARALIASTKAFAVLADKPGR